MTLPVWFYWEGPCPEWIRRCQATLVQHVADVRALDWTAFDALWDRDRDLDLGALHVAHRADVIRAFLLARYGGLWIDSDCVVMRPLDDLLDLDGDVLVAHRERQGHFSNAFVAATPGSRLARSFYAHVVARLRSGRELWWTALGGEALGAAIAADGNGLRELPCAMIQPICWSDPAAFLRLGSPEDHAARLDRDARTYMLSHSMVRNYQRDHPDADPMQDGTFFRFLLDTSAAAGPARAP